MPAGLYGAAAQAQDARIALIPASPPPSTACRELSEQNQLLESLLAQGDNGFLIFRAIGWTRGCAHAPVTPGIGIDWDRDAIAAACVEGSHQVIDAA